MYINITVGNISKTVKVNEECFVEDTVLINLIVKKDDKGEVVNFDYAVD